MRLNYVPIFPALWAIFCAVNILINYDYYMRTSNGRLLLFLFAVMMVLCAVLTVYLAMPTLAPRIMQKVSPDKRCPVCYSKLNGAVFCPKCGHVIDGSAGCTLMSRCGKCGASVADPDAEFCPKCGNMLRK
ncbi:MAG: zinc ribbon domain-containing protein [Candidatus Methanomethylophilaceae archaeon]